MTMKAAIMTGVGDVDVALIETSLVGPALRALKTVSVRCTIKTP